MSARPELAELRIADLPERWEALGFAVEDQTVALGGVALTLGVVGRGIASWAVRGVPDTADIDGLHTIPPPVEPVPGRIHPNGALAIDHVVVVTPDFDRTAGALEAHAMPLRRIRDAGGFRQGFRRLGPTILELVEAVGADPGPATFWGLTMIVEDLDALAERLGDRLSAPRDAVQPGRRIATLRREGGLSAPVAFMTPEPG